MVHRFRVPHGGRKTTEYGSFMFIKWEKTYNNYPEIYLRVIKVRALLKSHKGFNL